LRPHGSGIPSEPVYFSDTTKTIVRRFMKLRYELLPYFYTLTAEARLHGFPIVRPLFYEFQHDSVTYDIEFEYMLGDDVLVVPIVEKGLASSKIYLPSGARWYNFFTNKLSDGGKWFNAKLELETIPIFVKAGSFIPSVPYNPNTDSYNTGKLKYTYYFDHSGKTNSYIMFDDDGNTFGTIEKGEYSLLKIKREKISDGEYLYDLTNIGNGFHGEPETRYITLEIVGLNGSDIKNVTINQKAIIAGNSNSENCYYFDTLKRVWIIKFEFNNNTIEIRQYGMIH
jgi:oligosaccharide 4-alpha-D-glucosyltransferase